ncbi:helix-turn-helix domain-containing protein [Marispirochaeta sp.]|uniref:helix-turn-helix domain-containing protein n=1 Tax=Marispirochaeta sp. TaxID=2038653 RepID=UPI0029C63AFB|nr:helix-turn-helix domain-containing protein [Marispirochaeta sp.]
MTRQELHDVSRKLKVLNHAQEIGNISKTCRYFGICRETFYKWKRAYTAGGESALVGSKPCPENHKLRVPRAIEEKIINLRTNYHFGPDMIVWHLQRYHNIKISRNGCYKVFLRNKLNRLPENINVRTGTSLEPMRSGFQDTMYRLM